MKSIRSEVIGILTQDETFDDWWRVKSVPIPYFAGKEMDIIFTDYTPEDDPEFLAEADTALRAFLAKGHEDRLAISELVYQNCMDFLEAIGEEPEDEAMWKMEEATEVWRFVHPDEIYLSRRNYTQHDVYVQVTCECDWEQEHGLQIVLRQGRQVTRVSAQDGHVTKADAYDIPDADDELLSNFAAS